ncbi:hypothetical protein Dimus_006899 [Dionaea muscipula]
MGSSSSSSRNIMKWLWCAVLVFILAPHYFQLQLLQVAEGYVTCGTVSQNVAPCFGYLKKGGSFSYPPPACCNGVRALKNAAQTPADRQTACRCLKAFLSSQIDQAKAGGLPGKCGVSVPYQISPATDCNRVR